MAATILAGRAIYIPNTILDTIVINNLIFELINQHVNPFHCLDMSCSSSGAPFSPRIIFVTSLDLRMDFKLAVFMIANCSK